MTDTVYTIPPQVNDQDTPNNRVFCLEETPPGKVKLLKLLKLLKSRSSALVRL